MANQPANIDDYIASFPADVQSILEKLRRTIRTAVPGAEETVSYQMPTFTLDGKSVVHVAAWKNHIGMYPIPAIPASDEALEHEVAPYRTAKGIGRFPLDKPIPYDLIARLVVLLAVRSRPSAPSHNTNDHHQPTHEP